MADDITDRENAERKEAQRRLRGKNLAVLFALAAWVVLLYVIAFVRFPTG